MAWIESHQEVSHHPKTRKLARRLDISVPTAVGHLHCLWHWALSFAQDGDISKHDIEDVAIGAMWEGEPKDFLEALVAAGFIDDGRELHDWDEYTGRLIERRKLDAERKRNSRSRPKDVPPLPDEPPEDVYDASEGHPEDGVRNSTQPNSTEPNSTDSKPSPDPPDAGFDEFWKSYPQRRGTKGSKKQALLLWKKLPVHKREAAVKALPQYANTMGDFPKDAERYLRHEAWEGLAPNGSSPSSRYTYLDGSPAV